MDRLFQVSIFCIAASSSDVPDSKGTNFTVGFPPHGLITDPGNVYDNIKLLLITEETDNVNVTVSVPLDVGSNDQLVKNII